MKKYLVGWGLTSVSILSIVGIGSGCGNRPMVRSELHRSQTAVAGVIYSLPRQLVVFRFTREPADLAKLGAEYATKRQAALEAKAAFEARAKEVSKAEEDLKQATGDAKKKPRRRSPPPRPEEIRRTCFQKKRRSKPKQR